MIRLSQTYYRKWLLLSAVGGFALPIAAHAEPTLLLGPYAANPYATSTLYSASEPAAISQNLVPLYPERFSSHAHAIEHRKVQNPPTSNVRSSARIYAALPVDNTPPPTQPASPASPKEEVSHAAPETNTSTQETPIQLAALQSEPSTRSPLELAVGAPASGTAQLDAKDISKASPLALPASLSEKSPQEVTDTPLPAFVDIPHTATLTVPAPSDDAIARYQRQRGISGGHSPIASIEENRPIIQAPPPVADNANSGIATTNNAITNTSDPHHIQTALEIAEPGAEPGAETLPTKTTLQPLLVDLSPPAPKGAPKPQRAQATDKVQPKFLTTKTTTIKSAPVARQANPSHIAPTPLSYSHAKQANKDIIEPGITYLDEPDTFANGSAEASSSPIYLGQPSEIDTAYSHAPLTTQSQQVLAGFPSHLGSVMPGNNTHAIELNRTSPEITKIVAPETVEASYEAAGIKIEVSRPGLDTNYELSRAYDALSAGNSKTAIDIYRNILSVEPQQEEALFGLAATLHRIGAIDKARPLYASLLQRNPTHKESLNNYLSLVGDEAPEAAILELGRLRAQSPDFSAIPAQMGMLYAELGQLEQARKEMINAIALEPENLLYQYNLAIILDKQGNYPDAAALYGSLIKAHNNGAHLPIQAEQIRKRYGFLTQTLTQQAQLAR